MGYHSIMLSLELSLIYRVMIGHSRTPTTEANNSRFKDGAYEVRYLYNPLCVGLTQPEPTGTTTTRPPDCHVILNSTDTTTDNRLKITRNIAPARINHRARNLS